MPRWTHLTGGTDCVRAVVRKGWHHRAMRKTTVGTTPRAVQLVLPMVLPADVAYGISPRPDVASAGPHRHRRRVKEVYVPQPWPEPDDQQW
jgi:hypothetical protein